MHVFDELILIEALGPLDCLPEDLQFAVCERRQEITEQVHSFGRSLCLIFLDEIHDAGEFHRLDRFPKVDICDAVSRLAQLHLDRSRLESGETAAEHVRLQPHLSDRTQEPDGVGRIRGEIDHIRLACRHRADDRREIDGGRRIGPVVNDVDAGPLGVHARAFGGLVLEFGIGGDDRHRLRLRVLRCGQVKIALGKDFHRIGAERQHREVFRIMELVVGREREQSEEQPVVRDRNRHRRHHQIGAVARHQEVDLVDVDQLGIDRRHQRRVALVVVVDELDRPAEEPALRSSPPPRS